MVLCGVTPLPFLDKSREKMLPKINLFQKRRQQKKKSYDSIGRKVGRFFSHSQLTKNFNTHYTHIPSIHTCFFLAEFNYHSSYNYYYYLHQPLSLIIIYCLHHGFFLENFYFIGYRFNFTNYFRCHPTSLFIGLCC